MTDEEHAILTAFAAGDELAVIAADFGLSQSKLRQDLARLCDSNRDAARRMLHPATDLAALVFAEPPVPVPVPVVAEPEPVAGPPAAEPVATALPGAVIAVYSAHRCDPCGYTGPAGHHHATRRVRVHILEDGGA
jgi:hypothetical protein